MKNILVLSDLHGAVRNFQKIKRKLNDADHIFFCGDGYEGFLKLAEEFADKIVAVKGNCDMAFGGDEKIVKVEEVNILITHGHAFGVKSGMFSLYEFCKEKGVDVAFYGHTHIAAETVHGGVKMINPGAIADYANPSYYFCTVVGDKLFGKHMPVQA